jgi:hypothetical protein
MPIIKLKDMHVVDLVMTINSNTQTNSKECITHHERKPHDRSTGLKRFPKQLSVEDFMFKGNKEKHKHEKDKDTS